MKTIIEHKYDIGDKVYYTKLNPTDKSQSKVVEQIIRAIVLDKNKNVRYLVEGEYERFAFDNEDFFIPTREEAINQLKERLIKLINDKHQSEIKDVNKILELELLENNK